MKSFFQKILGGKKSEKRERSPRVCIPLIDNAVFVAANGKIYPLRNISETGLALVSEEDRLPDEVSGEIRLAGQTVGVKLLVVRRNGADVAATFAADAAPVRGLLRRVFVDEFQAQAMTEVSSDAQKPLAEGTPHWFYAPENYELFYVESGGGVTRFELGWKTRFLSFLDGSLRSGTISPGGRSHTMAMSDLVEWKAGEVDEEERRKALRILENIPGLDVKARRQIQALFKV